MQSISAKIPALLTWFQKNKRSFPFRESPNAYKIWVSEVMLQQTRMEAALSHYEEFMKRFPTLQDLADGDEATLLKVWEGLGYYSRAKNLQKTARLIVDHYQGQFPSDYKTLKTLPGIGDYTAGAIASIAFQEAVPAIDGNVLRVFARLTGYKKNVLDPNNKKELAAIVHKVLPKDQPGLFNEAVMELGETLCLPNTIPHCSACPFVSICKAHKAGTAQQIPIRQKSLAKTIEHRTVYLVVTDEKIPRVLLHKRPEKGLLAGLWEYPNMENKETAIKFLPKSFLEEKVLPNTTHTFSHKQWKLSGIYVKVKPFTVTNPYCWATFEELQSTYAVPSAFSFYTKLLQTLL